MIKVSTRKNEEVKAVIVSMRVDQLTILGFMGMARTIPIAMQIGKHNDFTGVNQFEKIIKTGIQRILHNYSEKDDGFNSSLSMCESLIPYLENYDFSDCIDKHDEDIMSIAYYLVEQWYYFIGLIAESIESDKYKKLGHFLTVPITCIDTYLCSKYEGIGDYKSVQLKVNQDILIQNELKLIDDDLKFVFIDPNIRKIKDIEERITHYTEHNILA